VNALSVCAGRRAYLLPRPAVLTPWWSVGVALASVAVPSSIYTSLVVCSPPPSIPVRARRVGRWGG